MQKVIIDISGTTLLPEETYLLAHKNTGGAIIFARNYENKAQLIALVKSIRNTASNPNFLICVDNEGGRVWRFKNHEFTKIEPAIHFGELYDTNPSAALNEVKNAGNTIARELLACGIDLTLAPVLDIDGVSDVIRTRAYHNDPEVITKLASKFIEGVHEAGMKSCGKHFPGHGGCVADTHYKDAVDIRSLAEIESKDLVPFKNLIEKLDYILVAHVLYSNVDSSKAVYSRYWLQDILRKKLQFKGLIISDCLSMEAANIGDYLTRVKRAFLAGCDLAILSQISRAQLKVVLDGL